MSDGTSCQDCGREWSSHTAAHCAGCCRHFSGLTAFDAHFVGDKCSDPPAFSKTGKPLFQKLLTPQGEVWTGGEALRRPPARRAVLKTQSDGIAGAA